MQILLVEDSPKILSILRHFVNHTEHRMLVAKTPAQALQFYQQKPPDLIMLDTDMPQFNCLDFATEVRALQGNDDWIPIIYLGKQFSDDNIAKGIGAGGDDYLTKPLTQLSLQTKITAMQRITDMRHRLLQATRKLAEANHQLRVLSRTDELTGIANRRAFNEALQYEWRRSCRLHGEDRAISLIMIDIDHFKQYNDSYGHQAGDQCLQHVAQTLQASLKRPSDFIFRYGGEEFAIILTNTQLDHASQLAEHLRLAIRDLTIHVEDTQTSSHVSISLGVSSALAQRGITVTSLLKAADEALYQAKQQGRNCVRTKFVNKSTQQKLY